VEDARLTVREAAVRLGVSEGAIRKRIDRGTIRYERDPDSGSVHVYLSGTTASSTHKSNALISRLENEVAFLRAELERRDRLLAAALERIPPQLEATPEPRESPETATAEETEAHPGGGQESAQRPWWRRVFGG
jgi:excisionase family DNA binding protein